MEDRVEKLDVEKEQTESGLKPTSEEQVDREEKSNVDAIPEKVPQQENQTREEFQVKWEDRRKK